VLSRLLQGFTETRLVQTNTLFGSGGDFDTTTAAGTHITQDTALKLEALYAGTLMIADDISTLPVAPFIRVDGDRRPYFPRPDWLDNPESGVSRIDHFGQVIFSLIFDGNSFTRILRDDAGVAGLVVLNPQSVECVRNAVTRRPEYRYENRFTISADEMIHIVDIRQPGSLRGISRIEKLKENLGLAAALEEFAARFFGQGSHSGGIIQVPGNVTAQQAKDLKDGFENAHRGLRRSHRPGLLSAGATWMKSTVDNDAAQFLESRKFAVIQVARLLRIPPSMLGVTDSGVNGYASVEQNGIHYVQHTLRPYIAKIEEGYGKLLLGRAFLKFNVDGLLRGDIAGRYAAYSTGMQSGFLNINDIHRLEDLRPVEGGDVYRVPLANIDLSAANLMELDKRTVIAQRLILAGFDPAAVLVSLGMAPIAHSGLPSTMLQNVAQVNPDDPKDAYKTA